MNFQAKHSQNGRGKWVVNKISWNVLPPMLECKSDHLYALTN